MSPPAALAALAAAGLAVWLASCATPLTQLVVVVDTDFAVPSGIDRVRVEVRGPAGTFDREEEALADRSGLPLTVGVLPASDALGPVQVAAVGYLGAVEVVRAEADVTLVRGETRALRLFLLQRCEGVMCAAGESCGESGCALRRRDALDPWTGVPAGIDAGVSDAGAEPATDGGPLFDAGPDAGELLDAGVDGGFVPGTDGGGGADAGPDDAGPVDLDAGGGFDAGPVALDAGGGFDAGPMDVDAGGGVDAGGADAGPCGAVGCAAGRSCCGASCVDLALDPSHCGACGVVCSAPPDARAVCSVGACSFTCDAGCTRTSDGMGCACTTDPPRPLGPPSASFVTSATPTLRWSLAPGTTGARVALCRDLSMRTACVSFDAAGASGAPPASLSPGRWYWRLTGLRGASAGASTGPVWSFSVPRLPSSVDTSWGALLDPDLDGFSDLVVGAPTHASGAGAALLYRASSSGPATTPAVLAAGFADLLARGTSVAPAGDFDGDGFPEVLVGAPEGVQGFAVMHAGGLSGLAPSPSSAVYSTMGLGGSLAAAGDLDLDGYADVALGFPNGGSRGTVLIGWGARTGGFGARTRTTVSGLDAGSRFGEAVVGAADSDGDGLMELLIGAPQTAAGVGAAYLFEALPPSSGAGVSFRFALTGPPDASARFGAAVARGDLDADGYTDFIVGAPGAQQARVYLGSPTGPAASASRTLSAGAVGFGSSLAVGDFNSDGYADLAVGSPSAGRVWVYRGGARGDAGFLTRVSDYREPAGSSLFGTALSSFADLSADGSHWLVVGAPASGTVHLYRPGAGTFPLDAAPTLTLSSATYTAASGFGAAL